LLKAYGATLIALRSNLNLIPVQGKAPPRKGRGRDGEAQAQAPTSFSFPEGKGAVLQCKAKLLVLPHQHFKNAEQTDRDEMLNY
jgi:hypothetical protein